MSVYDRWHTKKAKKHPATGAEIRCQEHDLPPSADHGKGDRWQVRWRDPDRPVGQQQMKKNFAKKKGVDPTVHAEAYDKQVQGELVAETYVDPNGGAVLFKDYAEEVLENRTLDPTSRRRMRARLKGHVFPIIGKKELKMLSNRPSAIQAVVRALEKEGLAPNSIKVIISHVSMIFGCAIEDRKVGRNPCSSKSVKLPPVDEEEIVPWTTEEMLAVRLGLPARYKMMVDLGAGVGLRQGELFGLSPDDIDWAKNVVNINRQVKLIGGRLVFALPKGGKRRQVPLEELLGIALGTHLEEFPAGAVTLPWGDVGGPEKTAKLIFRSARGKALRNNHFNPTHWHPAVIAAGLKVVLEEGQEPEEDEERTGMHNLRHYFASALLSAGLSILAVSRYLGHSSIAVTEGYYAHLMPQDETAMRGIIGRALRLDLEPSAPDVPSPVIGSD